MFKLLLTWRYFVRRRVAWIAVAAVALVVLMTVVVLSVMSGLLEETRERNHAWAGDVVLTRESLVGFAGWEGFLDRLGPMEEVAAATPVIRTFGLITPGNVEVEVFGVRLGEFCEVTALEESLHYQKGAAEPDFVVDRPGGLIEGEQRRGFIAGVYLLGQLYLGEPGKEAARIVRELDEGLGVLPTRTLTVFGLTRQGTLAGSGIGEQRQFRYVDDSETGLVDVDSRAFYVDFDELAELTYMDAGEGIGRVNEIRVRLAEAVALEAGRAAVEAAWRDYLAAMATEPTDRSAGNATSDNPGSPSPTTSPDGSVRNGRGEELTPGQRAVVAELGEDVVVQAWPAFRRANIAPAEREKSLMIVVFCMIGFVAIFIVFAIFHMIVTGKVTDLGVIKTLGASRLDVAQVFLVYGLLVGLVGGLLGAAVGWAIVSNANEIERALGVRLWNPEVYAIERIPDVVDPVQAGAVVLAAVISSMLGAAIPARWAGRLEVVDALRAE